MKIKKILIQNFRQFHEFALDLTDPNTGVPLDRICLIGRNGTGKSTILRLINHFLGGEKSQFATFSSAMKVASDESEAWLNYFADGKFLAYPAPYLEERSDWPGMLNWSERDLLASGLIVKHPQGLWTPITKPWTEAVPWGKGSICAYAPPDHSSLLERGQKLPFTSLSQALSLFKSFPVNHTVGGGFSAKFWELLIYHLKKIDTDWQEFLENETNQSRTVEEVRREFDESHPQILYRVAELWDRIIGPAGLEFDVLNARKPVQLNENLEAYVKVKSTGLPLEYNSLSTGIRNHMFRLGHIAALYFGRNVKSGILLLDEPENSLYPDFLYDLLATYESVVTNTQIFVATHNPIVAAQFRPEERFILDFDDNSHITVRKGVTPEGDDPNDLLEKDFEVRNLYGVVGLKNWERFLELRRLIPKAVDRTSKLELINEYMAIGHSYNFSIDAIPTETL